MQSKCIYCGNNHANTKDHVPQRNLFSKPRPNNLITVPCCSKCNESFKKDEDLFMAWILFGDSGVKKEGKRIWEQRLKRTYEKDIGLRKQITKSFKYIDVRTSRGIYLGKHLATQIDQRRIDNVIRKIVRGLFWEEYKDRIPNESGIEIMRIPKTGKKIEEMIRITRQGTKSWENIFEYRHGRVEDTFAFVWIMSFYRELYYVAFVNRELVT